MRRPVDLPLGPAATVECWTCHEVDAGHEASGDGARLRRTAAALCTTCHTEPLDEASPRFHAVTLGMAHAPSKGDAARPTSPEPLDHQSRQCLTCHDGAAARATSSADRRAILGHQGSHAAGARYRDARRRPGRQLRPEEQLPAVVQLVDGRVGCASCHSVWSRQPRMLSLPMHGSRLCRACHDV
ncbi:MAG: cytochrome c3 family protein [Planctomycetota bacterium]